MAGMEMKISGKPPVFFAKKRRKRVATKEMPWWMEKPGSRRRKRRKIDGSAVLYQEEREILIQRQQVPVLVPGLSVDDAARPDVNEGERRSSPEVRREDEEGSRRGPPAGLLFHARGSCSTEPQRILE